MTFPSGHRRLAALLCPFALAACAPPPQTLWVVSPIPQGIDAAARVALERTGARGLAIAVIDDGRPVFVEAWGDRNAAGDPLRTDTIMYGASLTKAVFAYTVMQLVEEGGSISTVRSPNICPGRCPNMATWKPMGAGATLPATGAGAD